MRAKGDGGESELLGVPILLMHSGDLRTQPTDAKRFNKWSGLKSDSIQLNKWTERGAHSSSRADEIPLPRLLPPSSSIFYDSAGMRADIKSSCETNSKGIKTNVNAPTCARHRARTNGDCDVKHTIKVNSLLQEGFWFLLTWCAVAKEHRLEPNKETSRRDAAAATRLGGLFTCSG